METKNAAIVRKHIGWGHIAQAHAAPINQFYTGFLNPYVNYHRPSAQAEVQIDPMGRKRRLYTLWRTPLETLLSLHRSQQYRMMLSHFQMALVHAFLRQIAYLEENYARASGA